VTQKALANRKHGLRYQNVLTAYCVTLYHWYWKLFIMLNWLPCIIITL